MKSLISAFQHSAGYLSMFPAVMLQNIITSYKTQNKNWNWIGNYLTFYANKVKVKLFLEFSVKLE